MVMSPSSVTSGTSRASRVSKNSEASSVHGCHRTPNSLVWKGVMARHLKSSTRFSWDTSQTARFKDFLMTVGAGFKNVDTSSLLCQLNLDGYEEISNEDGESVHFIIEQKVQRKLGSVANQIGYETLEEASLRRLRATQRPTRGDDNSTLSYSEPAVQQKTREKDLSVAPKPTDTGHLTSQETARLFPDVNFEFDFSPHQRRGGRRVPAVAPTKGSALSSSATTKGGESVGPVPGDEKKFTPPSHPRLKMPQKETTKLAEPSSSTTSKRSESLPTVPGPPQPPRDISPEKPVPVVQLTSPATRLAASYASPAAAAEYKEARQAVRRFAQPVSALEAELQSVEACFRSLSLSPADWETIADVVDELHTTICNIRNQSEFLQELTIGLTSSETHIDR
ncbi:hypothetical protein GGS23DRAFT_156512 [Durotheca rogersii]|uniref:uncharacterized protein n=1 Tax=Durotheca rogersii TaxID=419775 RepID=UPI00221F6D3F|nr:uncharacterized protein GGS23DRAFT_156512 [Durotheca rogersii]KAI5861167.1 hypothetical protein GGS23DRAFT_156512 [Durotheca rogersii]